MTDTTDQRDAISGPMLWLKRLGWMLLIWSASVTALAIAAWLMRALMHWADLK